MPVESVQPLLGRPLRTAALATPPRLRPKGPVGPEFYRQSPTAAERPRQSAVERLEADKAKYVKSPVALSKQLPIRPPVMRKPPATANAAMRPTRKTPTQQSMPQGNVPFNLAHLSNLINGVNDGHLSTSTVTSEDTLTSNCTTTSTTTTTRSFTSSDLDDASQGEERSGPPPGPDWSSPAKVRLKAKAESPGPVASSPATAVTVRRVDVMPQARPARTPPCGAPRYIRQPLQPMPLLSQSPLRPASSNQHLFYPRKLPGPSPLKPVSAPPKPDQPASSPVDVSAPAPAPALAPPPLPLPVLPPASPAITRLSSSSSRKRPSLTRSKSDMSERYSRAGTELERFFSMCGLDPSELQDLTRASSDIASLPRFRSASAPGSECGGSDGEEGGGGGEDDGDARERVPYGVSVIERNARVIKWLYGVKQAKDNTKGTAGIPLATKLLYGLGGVPYQITTVAMNVSLQIFLLDIVQMEAFYVSMILFVSRFWDAVTDSLVGYLVSRSRWTHIGKLMPWLILSTPFGVLSYVLMWFLPHGSMSHAVSVPWFLTTACLFETLMSCYNVPYLSLSMFLGGDQRDRDSATAYRMGVEMLAMLVASLIQGQVVAVYNTEREGACQQQLIQSPGIFQTTASPPTHTASLQGTKRAFLTSALVMGALFFLCSLLLFLGVKEQQAPVCSQEKVQLSYLTSLKMLLFHIPYQRLVLGFVFSALAFQVSLGNFALFCTYAAGLGSQFQHLLLVLLVAACIALPLWQAVLIRIGKKTTVIVGLSVFIPAVIVIACMPTNLPVFMMMCVLMGCSLATLFLLPWSMLPDVVDDFAKMNPSCQDLEPLFFSCYAFCSKLGGGLAVGISTMTLHFAGYRAGSCDAGDSVVMALIILFSPVSIVLLLIGLVFFYFYPINERQALQTQLTTTQPEVASLPEERVQLKSHPATKTGTLHRSKSLPYRHKSHNYSNLSKCSSVGHSVSRSNSHPQCHKQRVHLFQQQPSKPKNSNASSEYVSGSKVKSKVTWV